MPGNSYQTLLECRRRGFLLRGHGFTVDQIAIVLSLDHDVTPLRLYRYAAGLTAAQVVAALRTSDPSEAGALRESRLYDYESWPQTGRRPPAHTLRLLARLYGTSPARLVTADAHTTYPRREQDLLPT